MDRIILSNPVNRTAAKVTSKGFDYVPDKKVMTRDSDLPIPTRPIEETMFNNPCFVNVTGRKFGRFTVIGLAQESGCGWVVKCSCGTYTTRKQKAILNPRNDKDRCEHCRHFMHLQRTDYFRRTGKDID